MPGNIWLVSIQPLHDLSYRHLSVPQHLNNSEAIGFFQSAEPSGNEVRHFAGHHEAAWSKSLDRVTLFRMAYIYVAQMC